MVMIVPPKQSARPAVRVKTRLAPLKGLDLSSPLIAMKDGTALVIDDFVVREDGVTTRNGYQNYFDFGDTHPVTALFSHPAGLVSTTPSGIFVGDSALALNTTSGDWSGAVQVNAGGQWLVMVNGQDTPRKFNGIALSDAAITGVNPVNLFAVCVHHRRLFFAEKNTLNIWYLAVDAIEGPAKLLPLMPLCALGGSVAAIHSLENAGGKSGGMGRLLIATTKGELIIYNGNNPDKADSWSLAGVFTTLPPVNKKSFVNIGTEAYILTRFGLLSVSSIVVTPDSEKSQKSLTNKIMPLLTEYCDGSPSIASAVESQSNSFVLLNFGSKQLILSDTKAWSRFTGLSANSWCEHDGNLYFGTNSGLVNKYTGSNDGVAPIKSYMVDAYSRLGSHLNKQFKRVRPMFKGPHPYHPKVKLLVNENNCPETFEAAYVDDNFWFWDDISWPRQPMPWIRDTSSRLGLWRGINGIGVSAAIQFGIQTRATVKFTAYDIEWDVASQ